MKIRRVTLVWLGLLAATVVSWEFGHVSLWGDTRNAGVVILAIAFVKIRFVILDFMELRHAPIGMRMAGEAWVIGLGGVLMAFYRF